MKLLLKIQKKIINVPQSFYFIEQNQLKIDSVKLLQREGYRSGFFQLYYYLVQDVTFRGTVVSIGNNDRQLSLIVDNQNIIQNIEQPLVKYLLFSEQQLNIINFIVYSKYQQLHLLKLQNLIQNIQINDKLDIYRLLYQPIIEQVQLKYTIQDDEEFLIELQLNPNITIDQQNLTRQGEIQSSISSLILNQKILTRSSLLANIQYKMKQEYQNFINFVHFGSAQCAIGAFIVKLNELEQNCIKYEEILSKLETLSDPVNQYLQKIIKLKIIEIRNSFNSYELYLFQRYVIEKKEESDPFQLQFDFKQNYINDLESLAQQGRQYDLQNIHRLINLLPIEVVQQQKNEQFIRFINMIGNVFDQMWIAIKNISHLNDVSERNLAKFNIEVLRAIINSYMIQIQQSLNFIQLQKLILQWKQDDSIDVNSIREYNKDILIRLIHNLPFLLSTKGTKSAIQCILNIFGLSSQLISIYEYGNQSQDGLINLTSTTVNLKQNELNLDDTLITTGDYTVAFNFKLDDSFQGSNLEQAIPYLTGSIISSSIISNKTYGMIIDSNDKLFLYEFNEIIDKYLLLETQSYNIGFNEILSTEATSLFNTQTPHNLLIDFIKISSQSLSILDQQNFLNFKFEIDGQNDYALYDFNNPYFYHDNVCINLIKNKADLDISGNKYFTNTIQPIKASKNRLSTFVNMNYIVERNEDFNDDIQIPFKEYERQIIDYPKKRVFIGFDYSKFYDKLIPANLLDQIIQTFDISKKPLFYLYNKRNFQIKRKVKQFQERLNIPHVNLNDMISFSQTIDENVFNIIKKFIPASVENQIGCLFKNNELNKQFIDTNIKTQTTHTNMQSKKMNFLDNPLGDNILHHEINPLQIIDYTATNEYSNLNLNSILIRPSKKHELAMIQLEQPVIQPQRIPDTTNSLSYPEYNVYTSQLDLFINWINGNAHYQLDGSPVTLYSPLVSQTISNVISDLKLYDDGQGTLFTYDEVNEEFILQFTTNQYINEGKALFKSYYDIFNNQWTQWQLEHILNPGDNIWHDIRHDFDLTQSVRYSAKLAKSSMYSNMVQINVNEYPQLKLLKVDMDQETPDEDNVVRIYYNGEIKGELKGDGLDTSYSEYHKQGSIKLQADYVDPLYFLGWKGSVNSYGNIINFNLNSNKILIAQYANPITVSLDLDSSYNGTVSVENVDIRENYTESIDFNLKKHRTTKFIAHDGYEYAFEKWDPEAELIEQFGINPYSKTIQLTLTDDLVITASYTSSIFYGFTGSICDQGMSNSATIIMYINSIHVGNYSQTFSKSILQNSQLMLQGSVDKKTNYKFGKWIINEEVEVEDNPYRFNIKEDILITASFIPIEESQ